MTLKVGDPAPDFSLPSTAGTTISLSGLKGKKVVLYFYPKDDTPGCTKEACGFRDSIDDLTKANVTILGVSADDIDSHKQFVSKYDLNFPLLSDQDKSVSIAYGAWGEKTLYGKTSIGMNRLTFLMNEDGKLAKIWRKVKPDIHAQQVLEAAQKI